MNSTLRHGRLAWSLGTVLAILSARALIAENSVSVPNAQFEQGDEMPVDWSLVGAGRWLDRDAVEVTGTGNDSSYWRSGTIPFEPGRLYRFQTRARRNGGSGTAITGPVFVNRDQMNLSDDWQWIGHVFRVPDHCEGGYLRLGQWHATGAIQFDQVRLSPAMAVHRESDGLILGEGEMIRDGQYTFIGTFSHQGSNDHRVLKSSTTSFNSDRWTLGSGNQVTYEFAVPGNEFLSAQVDVNVNYHTGGRCLVQVSRDGEAWRQIAAADSVGTASGPAPDDLLPARSLQLRIATSEAASFQVNRVEFTGRLSGASVDAVGETVYAELEKTDRQVTIESMVLCRDASSGNELLRVKLNNSGDRSVNLRLAAGTTPRLPQSQQSHPVGVGQSCSLEAVLPMRESGEHIVSFEVDSDAESLASGHLTIRVPDFYRSNYGERIAGVTGPTAVWWCDATEKIPRGRSVPESEADAVRLEAAGNDREAAQIVVRPASDLHGLTATASALEGPGGSVIGAENIRILRVYYHFVHHATDATGVRDWWPDALPPLDDPIDVAAGENQPLWVLVYVPPGTQAGDYRGSVTLQADGFSARVPVRLRVWGFTLPKRNHLETAFGFSPHSVYQYHGLKTEEDKRHVLDLYFRSFAEHRISPYDPTPMDPIRVKFLAEADPPRAELDFSAFDAAMSDAVAKYNFTGYRLPVQGMGGGTFHARYAPKIGEFGEETAQYKAMFSNYVRQLESHLRDRGWLDMAYVYWFDEPAPRDFDFVARGMQRLKTEAPGLRRMLTEEPGDNVLAGLVETWCPVSFHYDHAEAEKRRSHGERFWWYVCTGPKAPYCTLFIDHPATELRIWHWQTWQRKIVGTLVWQTNYWTSSSAFPDKPQNPYDDPMGYVSGYSTPRGVKRYWGNGDGRFIYPPLAAAVPGEAGDQPVIAPPVSSIRWEMLREGVEDYEYLYRLGELIDQKRERLSSEQLQRYQALLDVPADITADMTTFATDPAPIYERRRAIAEGIEQLMAM